MSHYQPTGGDGRHARLDQAITARRRGDTAQLIRQIRAHARTTARSSQ